MNDSTADRKNKSSTKYELCDGERKVRVPQWMAKGLGYGKIASVFFGLLSAVWLGFVAIYTIPSQLKAHEASIETQTATLTTHHNCIEQLEAYKQVNIAVMEDVKQSLNTLIQTQAKRDALMNDINVTLSGNVTALKYLEQNINEIKADLKEIKAEQKRKLSYSITNLPNLSIQ